METAYNASFVVLPILYTLLVVAYARIFTRGPEGIARVVRGIFVITLCLHFLSILLRSVMIRACPLGSWAEFLTMVAFSIGLIYLVLEIRIGERATGIFAVTPAFLLQAVAAVSILGTGSQPEVQMGAVESLHSFAATVGLSAVVLCGVYAVLYLFLYRAIKYDPSGLFYQKIPPLETLSELNFVAAWVAFLSLSVTLMLGFWEHISSSVKVVAFSHPEVSLTLLLWLLYGGCIVARRFLSLGGKRLAYASVVGLILLAGILLDGFLDGGFHG